MHEEHRRTLTDREGLNMGRVRAPSGLPPDVRAAPDRHAPSVTEALCPGVTAHGSLVWHPHPPP